MMIESALVVMAVVASAQPAGSAALLEPVKTVFVDSVWSGSPVGFAHAIRNGKQYVAYYDSERRMTVACRSLNSEKWTYRKLEDVVGWDSHNYVTFAFDSEGYIHLSGNMHCVPLRYYRTTKPEDITAFVRVESMTGDRENRCTYPRFSTGPKGEMLFSYRDGGSGNGSEIVNSYDVKARKWHRYIQKPLFDGEGDMNAYYTGPARDKSGMYHFAWVWRDTPDCATNHDVSHTSSSAYDSGFRKSDGTPIELPLTIHNTDVIDPVPVKSGLLNNVRLSFDSKDRVMITYHKFDEKGLTQVYTARREESGWRIYRTTDWKDRWEFSGGGSIATMMSIDAPVVWGDGKLCQTFVNKYHAGYRQVRFLDEQTLRPVGETVRLLPEGYDVPSAKHTSDWQVNLAGVNAAAAKRGGSVWALRWESAGPNRDKPREAVPPASRLEVVEFRGRQF